MTIAKFALLFVIFVDVSGQGLILPLINTLVMDPSSPLLPADTTLAQRHFSFGLIIGTFYLFWFFGAVYISKLSDSIGRKNGILICLAGALVGYVLTILAILMGSLGLMVLGRAITGFTSGNQPIAQAAMVDLSQTEEAKTRNMGYCVAALSVGLVAGPLIAGTLSDSALLGTDASLKLPFYAAIGLVLLALFLVVAFFRDSLQSRAPLSITPVEVFRQLWRATDRPTVLRVSAVFFFFMFVWNTCYVFVDNYLSSKFEVGTTGASAAILILGVALIFASSVLVGPIGRRFSKPWIIGGGSVVMILSIAGFLAAPDVWTACAALVPLAASFAVGFPTLLSMFSASVDESEQGWVMGLSTALWTSGAGVTALIGGGLMSLNIELPFFVGIASAILTLVMIALVWRSPDIRRIAQAN